MMSSELDILIVGYNNDRFNKDIQKAFRHWQVYSIASPFGLWGREFRVAYYTVGALLHPQGESVLGRLRASGGDLRGFSEWQPEATAMTSNEADLLRTLRRSRHPAA